jgi:hypothetical protein
MSCALLWLIAALPVFAQAEDQIPVGFKVRRYALLWERNPFGSKAASIGQPRPSPFEKLFLVSWMNDGTRDEIFVINSETNEVQKIIAEPNQNNLCLVWIRPNPNPQLTEAVVSDGKEQGAVKFRFDVSSGAGQMGMGVSEAAYRGATAYMPNIASFQTLPDSLPKLQNSKPSGSASVQSVIPHHVYPGVPRIRAGG